jgi:hypothetical protein
MGDPYLSILLILISIGGSLAISIPLVRLSPKSRHSHKYKEQEAMLAKNNDMEKYGVYSVNGKRYYKGYEVNNDGRVNMTFSNLFDTECVKASDELEQLKYIDRKRQKSIDRQKRLGVKRYARLKSIGTVLLILALGLVALIGYILPAICVGIGILVALAFMSN